MRLIGIVYIQRCLPHVRTFGSSVRSLQRPIEKFDMKMEPFALLNLSSDIPVWIKPLNAHDFPNMDRFVLSIWSKDHSRDLNDAYQVKVDKIDNGLSVEAKAKQSAPIFCDIQLPMNADLNLSMQNDVEVSKMESGNLKIFMHCGNCRLRNMKCSEVHIHSKEGDVTSNRALHGDLNIQLEKGNLSADRLQGQNVNVVNQNGSVNLKTLYAVQSSIRCHRGDVGISSSHGETTVELDDGTLTVGCLDGNLIAEVKRGDVSVHIMRHQNLDLTAHSGNISLTTDQPNSALVRLVAQDVEISREVKLTDEKRQWQGDVVTVKGTLRSFSESKISCNAHKGRITFSFKDWLSSLGLT